ncbi:MAG: AraC family transcriptional regulator, partial [Pseudomonadota bacterium]
APFDLAWTSLAAAQNPAAHQLLPHGEPSLAIFRKRDSRGEVTQVRLVVCGPFWRTGIYQPAPCDELIALRLKPETSAAIFGIAPKEYAEDPTDEVPAALKCACAATLRAAPHALEDELLRLLAQDLRRFALKAETSTTPEAVAAMLLRQRKGCIKSIDLAVVLDVSDRHLRRRFKDHLGCSLKTYARYLQLTEASLAAEKSAQPAWAQIALDAGFHDQPHMINAFKAELGVTPRAFHRERRALSGFCNTPKA